MACAQDPPDARLHLNNLSAVQLAGLAVAAAGTAAALIAGVVQVRCVRRGVGGTPRRHLLSLLALAAPFVGLANFVAMLSPKSVPLANLLSWLYLAPSLYVSFLLLVNVNKGRQNLLENIGKKSDRILTRTPPFCCCLPLPALKVTRGSLLFVEAIILQAAIVRLVFVLVGLFLYFEVGSKAAELLDLGEIVTLPSLFAAIYGSHIMFMATQPLEHLQPYRYAVVFRLIDVFIMFSGLQIPIFQAIGASGVFGCDPVLGAMATQVYWRNCFETLVAFVISFLAALWLRPGRSALMDKYERGRFPATD